MKLIKDRHNRLCVLGDRCDEPTTEWKQAQTIQCTDSAVWFSAYPLTGGAVLVQEDTFTILRDVTEYEVEFYFRQCVPGGKRPCNPAAQTVIDMWEQQRIPLTNFGYGDACMG